VVTWQTDVPSNGSVMAGTDSGSYTSQSAGGVMSTSHSAQLSLTPGAVNYFRIISTNEAGQSRQSEELELIMPDKRLFLPTGIQAEVSGSTDSDALYSGTQEVILTVAGNRITRFMHDFSQALDLRNVNISVAQGTVSIVNLERIKTVYLKKSGRTGVLCVSDRDISGTSRSCNESWESIILCPAVGRYSCSIEEGYFVVSGLNHSSVAETCNWTCGSWTSCTGGLSERDCECACDTCSGIPVTEEVCSSSKTDKDKKKSGSSGGGSISVGGIDTINRTIASKDQSAPEKGETVSPAQTPRDERETSRPSAAEEPSPVQAANDEENRVLEEISVKDEPTTMLERLRRHDKGIMIAAILAVLLNVALWIWHAKARMRRAMPP
jgi:hypothetical protein